MRKTTRVGAIIVGAFAAVTLMSGTGTAYAQARQSAVLSDGGGWFAFNCRVPGAFCVNGPLNSGNTRNSGNVWIGGGGPTNESGNYTSNNGNSNTDNAYHSHSDNRQENVG